MIERPSADRGQTTQDFAFGISVFVLAVVAVITFVPNVTAPYAAGITEMEQEHGEMVARELVANLSTGEATTSLDGVRTTAFFDTDWGATGLQERFGLRETVRVNVTLRGIDPDDGVVTDPCVGPCAAGDVHRDQPAATAVRLVRIDDTPYRLEVRVW